MSIPELDGWFCMDEGGVVPGCMLVCPGRAGGGACLYLTLHHDMNMPIMSSSDVVNNVRATFE